MIRRGGWTKPAFRSAPRTRSRASWSAASARPTIVKPGRPGRDVDLDPDEAAVEAERGWRTSTVASTPPPYEAALTAGSSGLTRRLTRRPHAPAPGR